MSHVKRRRAAGADFVKTSTGFSTAGATAADVALMRKVVGSELGVKASGGIRTLEDFKKMVAAGASRVGRERERQHRRSGQCCWLESVQGK